MFGNKLRSWMEAVRSRKKQHRKEKQSKTYSGVNPQKHCVKWDIGQHDVVREYKGNERNDVLANSMPGQNNPGSSEVSTSGHSRYSANNLSSPESAYSTGYSTDGTSPGAPPENLLNTSKHSENCPSRETVLNTIQNQNPKARTLDSSSNSMPANNKNVVPNYVSRTPVMKVREIENSRMPPPPSRTRDAVVAPVSPALGMTSPRQRNRIRTNPWVPSGTLSPSPVKQTTIPSKLIRDSPRLHKRLSPAINRQRSLSSSSCSSLSGASVQLEPPLLLSVSDEDCTLNEMMGKYDESYVYEKETDILSDSDPTDCETDIDTGQDGGDEDDPFEGELDFIDNCSHLEFDSKSEHNTGHCLYYNYDVQRKRSSRRRATRRSNNKCGEKKRRSCSNKKKYTKSEKHIAFADGSKSAGATPLSVRRANSRPVSKLALQECLRKRSNSIGFYRNQIDSIDKRDKEADLKYRELITEAEQILRAMKTNGLSPRRIPGPANKRVELLRTTECAKPEIFAKNRIQVAEDNATNASFCTKIPSNTSHNCPRFSPKKNHITKFIISNSPILVKKEWEMQNNLYLSPTPHRKTLDKSHQINRSPRVKQNLEGNRVSPKQRRKYSRSHIVDSSSDSDENTQKHIRKNKVCPQSEPVRRKVYFGHDTLIPNGPIKTTGFIKEKVPKGDCSTNSTENLRQQVLLNTLVNLKKNLEDHSASLKQVYRSSQNIYV